MQNRVTAPQKNAMQTEPASWSPTEKHENTFNLLNYGVSVSFRVPTEMVFCIANYPHKKAKINIAGSHNRFHKYVRHVWLEY